MSDKRAVAAALREIAAYLEIDDANPYKIRAFENAARVVDALDSDLRSHLESGDLSRVEGIGKATGTIISELVRDGDAGYLEALRQKYPAGLLDVLRVPGLSAKKTGQLSRDLGIDGLDALEAACRSGAIAKAKGFGAKSASKILSGIAFVRRSGARFLLPRGLETAAELERALAGHPLAGSFAVSGEVRRRLEVINSLEICLETIDPAGLADAIAALPDISDVERGDGVVRGRWSSGVPLTLWLADPASFPLRLFLSTGSHDYVTWALEASSNRRGTDSIAGEPELCAALGVPWIEPELRESESRSFWSRPPASLVRQDDLLGILHVHSTWSDGVDPLEAMIDGAAARGYAYVGISDHSKSAGYAGGLTEERVRQQRAEIRKLRAKVPGLTIFHGTEADILADGSIDYDSTLLAELDFVIASVHSRFGMSRDEMTARLVRALENPYVTFLGHMTGRMLLTREGYAFDHDAVFDAAVRHGVMIEINGNPNRRDIDWRLIRRALDRGVHFSIHPDAHAVRALDNTLPGVWNARKAGLTPDQVFNTKPVDAVAAHLASRRARAAGA